MKEKKFRKCFFHLTVEQNLNLTTNDGIEYYKMNKTSSHQFNQSFKSIEWALMTAKCTVVI